LASLLPSSDQSVIQVSLYTFSPAVVNITCAFHKRELLFDDIVIYITLLS